MTGHKLGRRSVLAGIGALGMSLGVTGTASAATVHLVADESELVSAIADAVPGDRIVMQDGTWSNLAIVIGAGASHGTAASPITLEAETVGGVVLTGTSTLALGRNYWTVDGLTFKDGWSGGLNIPIVSFRAGMEFANNCLLTNTTLNNCNPPDETKYQWVFPWGIDNTVSYCHFVGKRNYHDLMTGDYVTAGARAYHVHHNLFEDIAAGASSNGYGAFTTGTGADATSQTDDYMLVERNLFLGCSGESEIISVKSSSNTIRHNTFVECGGYICLRAGRDNDIYGNYFFANGVPGGGGSILAGSGGIRISGAGHRVFSNYIDGVLKHAIMVHNGWAAGNYASVEDVEIVNNTIVNSATTGILVGAPFNYGVDNTPPGALHIANNILSAASGHLITYETGPVSAVYEANLGDGTLGITPPTNGITMTDPDLVSTPVNGYSVMQPSTTSPALHAGVPHSWVTVDVDGLPRPGTTVDIGAHESLLLPRMLPPLTRADVGPRNESPARRAAARRREYVARDQRIKRGRP